MTQEDKQLLLKDLCARLPYKVVVETQLANAPRAKYPVLKVLQSYMLCDFMQTIDNVIHKPYLRPMSSMTEEEKHYIDNRWGADKYGDIITYSSNEGGMSTVELADIIGFQDWLNKNMFDYRGLIPKGSAIEAPEGIYKLEE